MKAISSVIAVLLMLIITIALAGLSYSYLSGVFTSKVSTSFSIIDSYNDTVTIKNQGTAKIDSLTTTVGGGTVNNDVSVDLFSDDFSSVYTIPDPNTVGLWHFDEGSGGTTKDAAGYLSRDGPAGLRNFNFDATSGWTDGKFGKALKFDGSDDYVEVLDGDQFDSTDAMTVEVWIRPDAQTGPGPSYNTIATQSGSDFDKWELGISDTLIPYFYVRISGVWLRVNAKTSLSTGNWYHIAAVYDGSSEKIFINGNFEDSVVTSGSMPVSTINITIGAGKTGSGSVGQYYTGAIDEVKIYNRALSEQEIKARANPEKWYFLNGGSGGNWKVISNELRQTSSLDGLRILSEKTNFDDFIFKYKFRPDDGGTRLRSIFRYQDGNNYYSFACGNNVGGCQFEKLLGGVPTTTTFAYPISDLVLYWVIIEAKGTNIKMSISSDGINYQTFTATSSFNSGKIGFQNNDFASGSFDDVKVTRDYILPGETGTVTFKGLRSGGHSAKICTSSMCTGASLIITT